jgi:hypothetical protein
MANNDQTTREWKKKVDNIEHLLEIANECFNKKNWKKLRQLTDSLRIDNGMGGIPFSDTVGIQTWLLRQYDRELFGEMKNPDTNDWEELARIWKTAGKRSTRRHRSRRQRTRRHKK